ncbi:MAG: VCBS repeat-containing protein [Acidobacteria bacterium]|nr:VCBS repeat-containing protein [Acidobacteriota bacterium]
MRRLVCLLAGVAAIALWAQAPPPEATRKARLLLREGKTVEARRELIRLQGQSPKDVEIAFQIARSYLMEFYQGTDFEKRRIALGLAMEALAQTLKLNADHIPAMRAKAVIHARAELLFYDPNEAFRLAKRVAELEPHAHEYMLGLTDWLSGEVRFTHEGGHRVPHDPLLGLDRSLELLESMIDNTMPYSPEETAGMFQLGKTHSRRGNFAEAITYFRQALGRTQNPEQKREALREMGTSYYRSGDYLEAARQYYEALQWGGTAVDQWLLKVSLDQIPEGGRPPLSKNVLFPAAVMEREAGVQLEFREEGKALGIDRFDGNGTSAWGDIDGDGDLDLMEAGSGSFMMVFRNEGGKFRDATAEVGLAGVPSGYSLNLVDYDNDGKLDLYVSLNGWSGPYPNRLFRNTGGRFEDVSAKSGANDPGNGFVSVWGDLDNDGWLDLAIANGVLKDGSTPQIYRNNRDGTFTNMTRVAGIVEPPTYGAIGTALGDYDKDGDLDLLINGLGDAPNRLYRNDGKWRFAEVAAKAGLAQPPHNGFVCFFVDYNNDGFPDVLTTSLAPWENVVEGMRAGYAPAGPRAVHPDANRLFRNNRNGSFTDVTFEAKLYYPMGTMGAGVADLDNDGFVDFYFGTGDPQLTRLEPNRFFRNNGDGTFTDWTTAVGFARPGNKGHGVTFADLDNDGDLDIYAQLGGHYPGDAARNAFYRNLRGNRNRWVAFELRGTQSNRFGVGAQVTVRAGGKVFYREVKGSEAFGSTDAYRVHIGLGSLARIEGVEVRWPNGIVQELGAVEAGRVHQVVEKQEGRQP